MMGHKVILRLSHQQVRSIRIGLMKGQNSEAYLDTVFAREIDKRMKQD